MEDPILNLLGPTKNICVYSMCETEALKGPVAQI